MIIFNDKIELSIDAGHWFIEQAEENETNVFDLFEVILENYYLEKTIGE